MNLIGYREETLEQRMDFFEFAPVGMHLLGPDCRIKCANIAELEIMGYFESPAEYLNRDFREFFSERATVEHLLQAATDGRTINNYCAEVIRRDGSRQSVLLDVNARFENGNLVVTRWFIRPQGTHELPSAGAVALSADVVEKIDGLSEEEKLELFDELNDFFDNAPVGVHFVGLNGIMLRANKAEVSLLGYLEAPENYIGHHVREIHHDKAVVETLLQRLVEGRPVINHEAYLKRSDGSLQPVSIYSGLRLKGGLFQNTRCFLFDNPHPSKLPTQRVEPRFSWPRNED